MSESHAKTVNELLLIREARGLRVPIIARILFCCYGIISAFTTPIPLKSQILILFVSILFIGTNAYFLYLLRDFSKYSLIGTTGIILDVIVVLIYPFILYLALGQPSLPPVLFARSPLLPFCFVFIIIESLALRPVYPIAITAAAIIVQSGLIFFSLNYPEVTWKANAGDDLTGTTVNLWGIVHIMIFLMIAGSVLAWLNHSARKTIIQAAELEADRYHLMHQQANLILESRIGALGELVAGISHEMNNPLGVIKGNAQTWFRAISRIRDTLKSALKTDNPDDKTIRMLNALESNSRTTIEASNRIGATIKTLQSFARLDEAEFKQIDIHEALESALSLISGETTRDTKVIKQYSMLPFVHAYAGRLNQVFMTFLFRAFEATNGLGTIHIITKSDSENIIIQIIDDGKHLTDDQIRHLFDIRLEPKAARVQAGFGMAACHSIILQHKGNVLVESNKKEGTTITISLPI